MRHSWLWIAGLLLPLLMLGCKNRKAVTDGPELRAGSKEELIAHHRASHLRFKTLTLKGKAKFDDFDKGQSIGFTYRIDIAKDSLILVNVSKFGIPAMNMLITRDSVRMRIPINQTASECAASELKKMGGIEMDMASLQDFLLGESELNDPIELTSGKARPAVLRGLRSGYEVSWIVNSKNDRLDKVNLRDSNLGRETTLTYSDFEKVDGQAVASTVLLEVTQPQKSRILLQHSSIAIDKESVDFRFRIPASYKMVPCDQITTQQK